MSQTLPPATTAILLSYLLTTKRSQMISEAAVEAGLPETTVKNWVSNQGRNPRKRVVTGCAHSGYNLFCSDHMKAQGDFKLAGAAWSALPPEAKELYQNRARVESVGGGDEESRTLRRKKLIAKLKEQVNLLEAEGVHVGVMLNDPHTDTYHVFTTVSVAPFMRDKVVVDFKQFLCGGENQKQSAVAAKNELLKQVQDLFNRKYVEAGGSGAFPYKAVSEGTKNITVEGLPEGLPLKRPCAHGAKQLRQILDRSEQISVTINEDSVESRHHVKMNSPDSTRPISVKQEEPEGQPDLKILHVVVCEEEVSPAPESPPYDEPGPPPIKKNQEELLQRPEEPDGSPLPLLTVKTEVLDEDISSCCSEVEVKLESDTEDSDDWGETSAGGVHVEWKPLMC